MKEESKSVIDDAVSRLWIAPIGDTHFEVAVKIAERCLGVAEPDLKYHFHDPRKFSGGEYCPRFALTNGGPRTLKGKSVYIILIPGPYKSSEDRVERACITAYAAKENGADKVVLLATDFPHARQDRGPAEDENALGEATTVRWRARQFQAAGIDQVITTHEHTSRIAAFFAIEYGLIPKDKLPQGIAEQLRYIKVPEHINASNPEIQQIGRQVFKSISPHAFLADYILYQSSIVGSEYLKDGGAKLALKAMDKGNRPFIDQLYASLFLPNCVRVYFDKKRKKKNDMKELETSVERTSDNFVSLDGMFEIFADDGLETGGSLIKSVEMSMQGNVCPKSGKSYGTPADRLAYWTHSWLGGDAFLMVQETLFKRVLAREIVTTETRPYINDGQYHRFKGKSTVLRFASLWADAIIANELGVDIMQRYTGFQTEPEQHDFISKLYKLKRHSRHFLVEDSEPEKRKLKFYLR